jgi:hypothetical protein
MDVAEFEFEIHPKPPPPPPPPPPPAPYGIPERLPSLVYLSTEPPDPDSQRFLKSARKFHQTWQLEPIRVRSLGEIVDHLATLPAGSIKRIRIVLHAFFFEGLCEGQLTMRLFKQGFRDRSISKEMLRAWAESDGHGLSELCRTEGQKDGLVDLAKVVRPAGGKRLTILEHLLGALREAEPKVLIPFGLAHA